MNTNTSFYLAVIMPIYNGDKYIKEMLDSIIAQTYENWILFIVDDGSTDETFDILIDYARKDNRIKPIKRNRGPKGAQTCRNIGFELSVGARYIIFFDSDDIVACDCFEQRISYMETHPELDFAVFPARTFAENISNNLKTYYGVKFIDEDDLCSFFWGKVPFVVWNNIYKRDSLEKGKIVWDERILSRQDLDFNIQSILSGLKYEYAREVHIDYFYRCLQTSSISKNIGSTQHQESHLYLLTKILNNLDIEKKKNYNIPIKYFILEFTRFFVLSNSFHLFSTLMENPWIFSQKFFRYRLMLFYRLLRLIVLSGHSHYSPYPIMLLFPSLYFTYNKRQKLYLASRDKYYEYHNE